MTCGSDKSGIASSGICRMDHRPLNTRALTKMMMTARYRAEYSMIALIMPCSLWLPRGDCGFGRPNGLTILCNGDGRVPSPCHREVDGSGIDSIPFRLQPGL